MSQPIEKEMLTESGRIPVNPFAYAEKRERDIVCVLLSDLHLEHKKLEKLKGWHKDCNNDIIDYVLVMGDFDNLTTQQQADFNECCRSEARITNLLNFLEFFSCPILLIPGNHDPHTMLKQYNQSEVPRLTQHSLNIHSRAYTLSNSLSVLAFGGSVPGYTFPGGVKTELWEGYPFTSEEQLADAARTFINQTLTSDSSSSSDAQQQFILMTHVGPYNSSTTIVRNNSNKDEDVYSGSTYFDAILNDFSSKIVAHVHGHTHESLGRQSLYKTSVINPGSIQDGNFAKIALHKDSASQKWTLRSNQFINLNSF